MISGISALLPWFCWLDHGRDVPVGPGVLGMLATCASAVLLTLLLQSIFGKKIGILTVNLGTIVFVVACRISFT